MPGVLSYALSLQTSGFTSPMRGATGAVRGFAGGITSLAGKLTSLPVLLTGAATGAGILGTAFKAFKAAADMESTITSFSTLLGSTQKATDLMKKLQEQEDSTGNTLDELAAATRSLLSVSDEDNLIADLRMIGDLAAASQKPIEELASVYAKIKGGDLVQAEDLNQLSDALGGGLLKEFQKVLGVDSVAAVRKLGSEGKISGAILDQVFRNLTAEGGLAFEAMKDQSETTNGLLSTLKSSLQSIMRTLGEPINDLLKPVIKGWINRAKLLGVQLKGVFALLGEAREAGKLGAVIGAGLQLAAVNFINTMASGIRSSVAFLAAALPAILASIKDSIFDEKLMLAIKLTFRAAGFFIESAGLNAAAAILEAIGKFGAAEKALELRDSADKKSSFAGGFISAAQATLEKKNFADIGEVVGQGIEDALRKGSEAAKKAGVGDLIDPKKFEQKLKDLGGGLGDKAKEAVEDILNPKLPKSTSGEKKPRGPVKGLKDALDALNEGNNDPEPDADLEGAKQRLAIEKEIVETKKRGGGLKDAAASALARITRSKNGEKSLSNTDRLGLISLGRRRGLDAKELDKLSPKDLAEKVAAAKKPGLGGKLINPARAAEALAKANSAADPRRGSGSPAADPGMKREERLLKAVESIQELFTNLATA